MPRERLYYVYMTTSSSRRALYTGVTNNIYNRHDRHEDADDSTFVGRYPAFRLVYVEVSRAFATRLLVRKKSKGGRGRRRKR